MIAPAAERAVSPSCVTAPLTIRLFGPFRVECAGAPLPKMRTRKEQWLLALLVLHAVEKPVQREWLASCLWPETTESGALYNLRRSLAVLRDALGPEAARILAPSARTLQIGLEGADCDVLRFDSALRASGDAGLAEAISLHHSPLLMGCSEEWVLEPRAVRQRSAIAALEALARSEEASGQISPAMDRLRQVLDLDPLRETALRALMSHLAVAGNHAAALDLFRDFRRRLLRDMNAEPDPETVQLNRRILLNMRRGAEGVRSASAKDPAAGAVSLSEGLARPASTLPPQYGQTVGRAAAFAVVRARVREGRLVTLIGSGGIGKTRLAVCVAEQALPDFADGAVFVDLAPRTDPELVPSAVADALRLPDQPGLSAEQLLVENLRPRQVLIVLDNCEHVLGASGQLAELLLRECANVKILATSREPLRLPVEYAWRVPSLTPEDAVELFEHHARAARPVFQPGQTIRASISQICGRLDGIPLAIEMAAAWMRAMTAAQIAERLDDAFRLLARTDGDTRPRHKTLRATLDWSYGLLTERERILLARLAIFAGGWTLEAAEAVCSLPETLPESEVLETLVGLVDRSLVVYREDTEGAGRYSFLETTRAYAAERLTVTDRAGLHQSLARYLLETAEAAKKFWSKPEENDRLDQLDLELPNVRVAMRYLLAQPDDSDRLGLRLSSALLRLWWRRGHMAEGRKFLTAALRNENPIVEDAVRSAALNARGALANLQRDSAAALEDHRAALAIRQAQHDQRGAATSLHNLAMVHADRTEYAAAVVAFQSAAALYRAVGDAARADHNEHSADEIATHHLGAPESNSSARIRALEAAVQRGDRISEGDCCMAIAMHASRSADFARANQFYRRALRIRLEDQYPLGIADALEGIAAAFGGQGRSADIPLLYAAADSLRTLIGCPIMSANRAPYEQNMRQARETLGEAAFAAAWSAGAALPYSNAVAHALDESLDAMAG